MSVAQRKNPVGEIVGAVRALATGLGLTWQVMLRRKVTVKYPVERLPVSNRFHGLLALPIDPETGKDLCIICFQCERVCPSRCIHIEAQGKGKERVLSRFDIEMDKCQYCAFCVEVCPTEPKAIVFVPHYESSTFDRSTLLYNLDDLHRAAPKEPIATGIVDVRHRRAAGNHNGAGLAPSAARPGGTTTP
ncbi:MAG TPA: NADH-quinone oxidoreductase subunit I [bacterium]|nr:NADH-quinone oxidoreductase subunit I [bacterium]